MKVKKLIELLQNLTDEAQELEIMVNDQTTESFEDICYVDFIRNYQTYTIPDYTPIKQNIITIVVK